MTQIATQYGLRGLGRAVLLAGFVLSGLAISAGSARADPFSAAGAYVVPSTDFPGNYDYGYSIINTSTPHAAGFDQVIVDWELPIFALDDVLIVFDPPGWRHEFVTPRQSTLYYNNPSGPYGHYRWSYDPAFDPFIAMVGLTAAYGPNPNVFIDPPYIIHWYTCALEADPSCPDGGNPIREGDSLSGFRLVSFWPERNAPYQASFAYLPPATGDPPIPGRLGFISPNSPARQAAQNAGVPEPSALILMGLGGAGFLIRRRQSKR
jgi:hypothetical protein